MQENASQVKIGQEIGQEIIDAFTLQLAYHQRGGKVLDLLDMTKSPQLRYLILNGVASTLTRRSNELKSEKLGNAALLTLNMAEQIRESNEVRRSVAGTNLRAEEV